MNWSIDSMCNSLSWLTRLWLLWLFGFVWTKSQDQTQPELDSLFGVHILILKSWFWFCVFGFTAEGNTAAGGRLCNPFRRQDISERRDSLLLHRGRGRVKGRWGETSRQTQIWSGRRSTRWKTYIQQCSQRRRSSLMCDDLKRTSCPNLYFHQNRIWWHVGNMTKPNRMWSEMRKKYMSKAIVT